MSRVAFFALFLLSPLLVWSAEPAPTPVTAERELFNGSDLTNWYVYIKDRGVNNDPEGVFTIRDGLLHITGAELGCITTNETFANYRLIVEYRWTGVTRPPRTNNARDCGILVHSVGEDGGWGKTWIHSIECNIIEGGTGDFIVVGDGSENFQITALVRNELQKGCGVYDPNGKPKTIKAGRINWFARDPAWTDTVDFRGEHDLENPVGEWNTVEVICDGDTITNIVNGTVANVGYAAKPSAGKIQIQSEFAEIQFRRITILPLEK